MSKYLLSAVNIKKNFSNNVKVCILKDISLNVRAGESVGIIGESGQGKSTLLLILSTLAKQSSGELFLFDKLIDSNINLPYLRNKKIGFLFQQNNLLDDYTAIQNILMPMFIARENISKTSPNFLKALSIMEEIGIEHHRNTLVKYLSGGEKQRVALARAIIKNPAILFVDEPTGSLDKKNASIINQILVTKVKESNSALIAVTHDKILASMLDTSYILQNGHLNINK